MSKTARGSFEIQRRDHAALYEGPGAKLGRTTFDKQFQGELVGTSVVEMLAAMSEVKGSAGYVALERVTASLEGKQGSFVLQHLGTMKRGVPSLSVGVVPDSADGELRGLAGKLQIDIVEGKHFYTFDYAFEAL